MSVLPMPALETAIIVVSRIDETVVGDNRKHYTVEGTRYGCPADRIQVCTMKDWHAALCSRSEILQRPVEVSWRNYGHGQRRIALLEWAH